MLSQSLLNKRCIMVCGGGGVGKTTIAASIAVSAAKVRKRVLVITIDPSKRLLDALGFTQAFLEEGGEPLAIATSVKEQLGLEDSHELSVAVLNPKYVLAQIVDSTLNPGERDRLKGTKLYRELSELIYGLQEYTAYEWVTRMIANNEYDLIVLDTPPAFHAKDFFRAPDRIKNLMESRVFQVFLGQKGGGFFSSILSFGWVEKLLGASVFGESKIFFEVFHKLRERILERCESLAQFFKNEEVEVIAVSTLESSSRLELLGLIDFLKGRGILVNTVVFNQIPRSLSEAEEESLIGELKAISQFMRSKSDRAQSILDLLKDQELAGKELIEVEARYFENGFELLKQSALQIGALKSS